MLDSTTEENIVRGRHGDPFSVLGMHQEDGALVVRAFLPDADAVTLIDARDGHEVAQLPKVREEGLFAGIAGMREHRFAYRLRMEGAEGSREIIDPYSFGVVIDEATLQAHGQGGAVDAYRWLGAHPTTHEGIAGVAFAVWAPNASRVSVVGSFNNWDGRRHPMRLRQNGGIWEVFLPGVAIASLYKYEILDREGHLLPLKADPCGVAAEQPPSTASRIWSFRGKSWNDREWMDRRADAAAPDAPIAIYEVHLGSWRRRTGDGNRYLSYLELADELIPYVQEMGFTHIELLPVTEYPFDGSWGYQPIGMFAPTSRFGTPDEFRVFIERCHEAEIGVLMDWVPAHFPSDAHGLSLFDGTNLYEHADPRKGRHMDWDTLIYNFGRREVANYLIASALYWLREYHIDGLRVDAVASMLYLDYSRKEGEWEPNIYGGNENLEAVEFLKRLNVEAYGAYPGAFTVAEESTAWPMVSRPTYLGGLGFGYKWNMGWMHDTLSYFGRDPVHRRHHHDNLTFGLVYAFAENFVLPLSHDEVVHGKGSLIGRMPGDRWQKFANLRAYFAFMYTHPGKKLLFMGGEFAQEREWNHDRELDWYLLDEPLHQGVKRLVRDLNMLYRNEPALHQLDCDAAGFEWIDCTDVEQSVISYIRNGAGHGENAIVVCNLTPMVRERYRIGVPAPGVYVERLNTDSELYGGSGLGNYGSLEAQDVSAHGRRWSLELVLPPLSTLVFKLEGAAGDRT